MIITFLLKHWRKVVDILIVFGGIFLLLVWNPFGLFGKGLKLQDTANMVSQIREIGQLITAEYYGEVIASEPEATFGIVERDTIEEEGEKFYLALKQSLESTYTIISTNIETETRERFARRSDAKQDEKVEKALRGLKTKVLEAMADNMGDFETGNSDLFYPAMVHIAKYEHNVDVKDNKIARQQRKEKDSYFQRVVVGNVLSKEYAIIDRYLNGDASYANYIYDGFRSPYPFTDTYLSYHESLLTKEDKKRELAVIGRGSVKAGFDFQELDETNFVYDPKAQEIHFYGMQARILNEDINPWFIPQKRIPGYQIIVAKNADFHQMKRVKEVCIEKLVRQARTAGIEQQAQKNGEDAFQEFFSLVLGEDIKKVYFHDDQLAFHLGPILSDDLITEDEIPLIDSIVNRNLEVIHSPTQSAVITARRRDLLVSLLDSLQNSLMEVQVGARKFYYPFNYYTKHLPSLLRDSMITQNEIDNELRSLRYQMDSTGVISEPSELSFWFTEPFAYALSYNLMIDSLSATAANDGFFSIEMKPLYSFVNPDKESWPDTIRKYQAAMRDLADSPSVRHRLEVTDSVLFHAQFKGIEDDISFMKYPISVKERLLITGDSIYLSLPADSIRELVADFFTSNSVGDHFAAKDPSLVTVWNERHQQERLALIAFVLSKKSDFDSEGPFSRAQRRLRDFSEKDGTLSSTLKAANSRLGELAESVRERL